jgi:hypothetical protein
VIEAACGRGTTISRVLKDFATKKKNNVSTFCRNLSYKLLHYSYIFVLSNKDTSLMFPYILIRLVPHYAHLIKNKNAEIKNESIIIIPLRI